LRGLRLSLAIALTLNFLPKTYQRYGNLENSTGVISRRLPTVGEETTKVALMQDYRKTFADQRLAVAVVLRLSPYLPSGLRLTTIDQGVLLKKL
jgi:hypothetical protein